MNLNMDFHNSLATCAHALVPTKKYSYYMKTCKREFACSKICDHEQELTALEHVEQPPTFQLFPEENISLSSPPTVPSWVHLPQQ